jgi:hypothetical protein
LALSAATSQGHGSVPKKFQKMLMVSKKIVYEETRRKIHILIHKSYIGIEIVFYFPFLKRKIDFHHEEKS